jgi:hypothetical protein
MLSRLVLAAALTFVVSAPLVAQGINRRMQQQQQPAMAAQLADIQGVLEGVTRGGIMVAASDSKLSRVVIPPTAKVTVTGTATVDYLQTGMLVEFQGEIDDQGKLAKEVDALKLVTVDKPTGFFPPESGGDQGGLFGGAEAGGGDKSVKHAKKPAAKGPPAAGSYRIVGKLLVGRGKFSVHVGRSTLPLELSDQTAVTVESSDYMTAHKGDKVTVKGMAMPSKMGPIVQATEVKIELSEPLVGAKKKGSGYKADAKRPAKRPKKDAEEGLPEPAAEK